MDKEQSFAISSCLLARLIACLPAIYPTPFNPPMLCVMVRMHNKYCNTLFSSCFHSVVFTYLCKFQQLHRPKWFQFLSLFSSPLLHSFFWFSLQSNPIGYIGSSVSFPLQNIQGINEQKENEEKKKRRELIHCLLAAFLPPMPRYSSDLCKLIREKNAYKHLSIPFQTTHTP